MEVAHNNFENVADDDEADDFASIDSRVVRTDKAVMAGTEIRNKIKYLNFLRKKKLTNPKKGPFHHRAPSDIFVRCVRSMLPRYTKRGALALRRLVHLAAGGEPKFQLIGPMTQFVEETLNVGDRQRLRYRLADPTTAKPLFDGFRILGVELGLALAA